jgi:cell division FtsZ-interacting protein ZapD
LASDALLTTLHPLLENVLQTVCRKLQKDNGTGSFDLGASFSWLEKPRNLMALDLDSMADVLIRLHRSH